jgi:hypothetical protein
MRRIINYDQWVGSVRLRSSISLCVVFVYVCLSIFPQYAQITLNTAHAGGNKAKFNESDFMIKEFGIGDDGYPFLTVEGKAGGTVPQEENRGYAYVFVTDNGTYTVVSDWMYPKWHTYGITLDDNNCVGSMNMKGGTEVGDAIKLTKTKATKVDKVMTAEFSINKNDGSICADKIFDYAP